MSIIKKYLKQVWKPMLALLVITILATFFTTLRPIAAAGIINITLENIGFNQLDNSKESSNDGISDLFDLNEAGSKVTEYLFALFQIQNNIEDAIPYFIFILLALSVLASTIKFIGHLVNALTRSKVMQRLRSDLTMSLLDLSLSFYNNKKSGELISRIITDSQQVGQGVVSVTHRILHSLLVLIVYFVFLLKTNINLTLGVCVIIALHYCVTLLIQKPIKNKEIKNLESIASLTSSLQEIFSNIRLIKTYSGAKYTTNNLQRDISRSSRAYSRTQIFGALEVELRYLLDGLAEALILFVSIYQLFSGAITIQGFLLYIYVARLMLGPINEFSSYLVWLQKIIASSYRIEEYSSIKSDIKEGDKKTAPFNNRIEIKGLSFSYTNKRILKDLNLVINKGEKIAIVGPSGAGKSTLLDIILRFYDPNSGAVLMDDINIKNFRTDRYRDIFGVVSQDVLLLNDTISNNINYGRGYDLRKIKEAAKIANADDFIESFDRSYQTVIGDRGVKLSGGQKQRLSIARAIVGDPDILLLDEATSSLDTQSEIIVQEGINKALKTRTAIIIAHRLSTIINANKIIVLNNGCIDSIGTHQELSKTSELYKRLYEGK